MYREDRWEYPLLALREIVINAVLHRDYSVLGSDIKVAIFDDMIEVTSPGVLLIDKEKLGFGYSELRNQNFGNLFKKFKIIEQWGTGFEKIKTELQEYPEIKMKIDDESSFVQIKLLKITSQPVTTPNTTPKEMIIAIALKKNRIKKEEMAELLGITVDGIKYHLRELAKSNILKWVGHSSSGYWKINKSKQ